MNGLSIHLIDRGNAFGRKDERGIRLNSGWLLNSFIFTVRARIKGKTQQELNESELLKEPSWARSVLLAPSPVFPDLTKTKINTPTPSLFMRAYSLLLSLLTLNLYNSVSRLRPCPSTTRFHHFISCPSASLLHSITGTGWLAWLEGTGWQEDETKDEWDGTQSLLPSNTR